MHKTEKPTEDSQDGRDEAFLLQHSSRPSTGSLDQVREELVKMLELSRTGEKAVDPIARSFASGRVSGIESALKLIDKALQAEASARIRAAAQGGKGLPRSDEK